MAEFFKWDPAVLSVRVAAMDAAHIALIKQVNALHASCNERKPKSVLAGLLDDPSTATPLTRAAWTKSSSALFRDG